MSEEEIQATYGEKKTFEHYERIINSADNIKKADDSGVYAFEVRKY